MAEVRYGGRKTRVGVVVKDRMSKTVVVAVEAFKHHRLYKKLIRRAKRYKAHDEENACQVGDKVLIVETRPLSRDKRWRVAEILVTAALPEEEKAIIEEEEAEELRELDEATAAEAPPAKEKEPEAVEEEKPVAEEKEPEAVEEEEPAAEEKEPEAVEEEQPEAAGEKEPEAVEEEVPEAVEEEQPPAEEEKSQAEEGEQPEEEEKQES